jgi:DNA-binding IclR family transcriptional regulator
MVSRYRERNSTADRALEILQLFGDDRLVMSGGEIAGHLDVAKSTAYRYLQSLTLSGFLEETEQRAGYRLGPRLLELAALARRAIGLSEISRPVMRRLAAETGQTVLLTRRSGAWIVCLEREESIQPIRLSYERGHILPADAGAPTMVLLAWEPRSVVDKVLRSCDFDSFGPPRVGDPVEFHRQLRGVRSQGYACSIAEFDADIVGISAPVRDHSGDVVAAVGIACLAGRISVDRLTRLAGDVVDAGRRISDRIAIPPTV